MEETKNEVVETASAAVAPEESALFAKLDEIIAKRSQGIIKSVLKDNGVDDSEVGDILGRYKAQKQAEKNSTDATLTELKTKNSELTKKLFDIELNRAAATAAAEIGMHEDKVVYAMKLADTTKAVKDGTIDAAELKAALEAVLTKLPEFKKEQTQTQSTQTEAAIRKLGVASTEPETTDALAKMRKALGITTN